MSASADVVRGLPTSHPMSVAPVPGSASASSASDSSSSALLPPDGGGIGSSASLSQLLPPGVPSSSSLASSGASLLAASTAPAGAYSQLPVSSSSQSASPTASSAANAAGARAGSTRVTRSATRATTNTSLPSSSSSSSISRPPGATRTTRGMLMSDGNGSSSVDDGANDGSDSSEFHDAEDIAASSSTGPASVSAGTSVFISPLSTRRPAHRPCVLTIKRSPLHTVTRTSQQLKLPEARQARGDATNTRAWHIGWVDKCSAAYFKSLGSAQRVNHVPGIEQISRKRNLARCLKYLMSAAPTEFAIAPRSWTFPADHDAFVLAFNDQRAAEAKAEAAAAAAAAATGEPKRPVPTMTYILKPGSGCEGRGIFLVQNLTAPLPQRNYIAQEYLARPLLINKKKFDMRIYVALTSVSPLRAYVFQDGLARFCTEDYVTPAADNLTTLFGHLTNFTLNKKNTAKFSVASIDNDDDTPTAASPDGGDGDGPLGGGGGSKWTLVALNSYLSSVYGAPRVRALWRDINDVLTKTLLATLPHMQQASAAVFPDDHAGSRSFQLLGFDIMLDEALRPWLIEVNRNPSLRCDSPLDQKIKTMAMGQLFHILDPPAVATAITRALAPAPHPADAPGVSRGLPLGAAPGDTPLSPGDEALVSAPRARAASLPAALAAMRRQRRARAAAQVRLEHEDRVVAAFQANAAELVKGKVQARAAAAKSAAAAAKPATAAAAVPAGLYDYGGQETASPTAAGSGAAATAAAALANLSVSATPTPAGDAGDAAATDSVTNVAAVATAKLAKITLTIRDGYPVYPAAWQRLYPTAPFADYPCGAPLAEETRASLTEYGSVYGAAGVDGTPAPAAAAAATAAAAAAAAAAANPAAAAKPDAAAAAAETAALAAGISPFYPLYTAEEARARDALMERLLALAHTEGRHWERDAMTEAMSVRMVLGPAARPGAKQVAAARAAGAPLIGPDGVPVGWGAPGYFARQ